MAAPIGNQFWKLRSKHGRDKLFSTPELLWEAACEYFEWCEENPFKKQEAKVVSGGREPGSVEIANLDVMRPFTLHGLCNYIGCNTKYFNDFGDVLKGKEDENSKGFSEILTRIRETIYDQKFSGAASGFLNASIIARDLGLKEQTDITSGGDKIAPVITTMKDGQILDGELK